MSLWVDREDWEAFALLQGHLDLPRALEDGWDDFTRYSGSQIDFHKDRKVRCAFRYTAPKPDADETEIIFTNVDAQAKAYAKNADETVALLATAGLKLGQVRAPAKVDPTAKVKGENNVYSDNWKGTEEARLEAIIRLIKSVKTPEDRRRVASLAASGGRSISGKKLPVKK